MIVILGSKKHTDLSNQFVLLSKEMHILKHNLKGAFTSIKDDLDMHLDTINQNTNEIQANYEYVAELEAKIDKISDKVDELYLLLSPALSRVSFDSIKLLPREQEIFMYIYLEEDRIALSYLAKKACLPLDLCDSVITSLSNKGIPIIRQLVDGVMFLSLDYTFKDLQARKNILKIDMSVAQNLV